MEMCVWGSGEHHHYEDSRTRRIERIRIASLLAFSVLENVRRIDRDASSRAAADPYAR